MFKILLGNALEVVKQLDEVHSVVTSPPYFKKRIYGESPSEIGRDGYLHEYIGNLIDVFSSIPLVSSGSIWVNIGDKRGKDGELLQIPEIFSLEMRKKGFLLVDHVIWAKVFDDDDGTTEGGCMTEPAPGRLNGNGFEPIFRFVRNPKAAWSDTCAVRIPRAGGAEDTRYLPENLMGVNTSVEGRNLHNVWRVQMGQTSKKHYAVYPAALCERPIAMTCPLQVCTICGHQRSRITEMVEYDEGRGSKRVFGKYNSDDHEASGRMDTGRSYVARKPVTTGWTTCGHDSWAPGVVLDPFTGSGTTGEVALKLGRRYIGIDLYEDFTKMSAERCAETLQYLSTIEDRKCK